MPAGVLVAGAAPGLAVVLITAPGHPPLLPPVTVLEDLEAVPSHLGPTSRGGVVQITAGESLPALETLNSTHLNRSISVS